MRVRKAAMGCTMRIADKLCLVDAGSTKLPLLLFVPEKRPPERNVSSPAPPLHCSSKEEMSSIPVLYPTLYPLGQLFPLQYPKTPKFQP